MGFYTSSELDATRALDAAGVANVGEYAAFDPNIHNPNSPGKLDDAGSAAYAYQLCATTTAAKKDATAVSAVLCNSEAINCL